GVVTFGSANTSCGIVQSTDGGATFSVLHSFTNPVTGLVIANNQPNPNKAKVWVATTSGGDQFGNNGGTGTFVALSGGPASASTIAVDPSNTSNLYGGAFDKSGIYVSANADVGTGGSLTQSVSGLNNVSIRMLAADHSANPAVNAYALGDFGGMLRTS